MLLISNGETCRKFISYFINSHGSKLGNSHDRKPGIDLNMQKAGKFQNFVSQTGQNFMKSLILN